MDRTHIRQRRIKRHLPYILAAVLATVVVSFLYFKWYDLKPIKTPIENTFEYLMEGNRRFATGHPRHPDESVKHRQKVASGQHPLALVVTCSDSRLSPELIFDQGLGDLFVIRTAGNVISNMELGSIEYAVEHLGVKTIVVMGHEHCGAIEALMREEKVEGHIKAIIDTLKDEEEMKKPLVRHNTHEGVLANVRHQVNLILNTSAIMHKSHEKPIMVKGVVYDMDNGVVNPLDSFFTEY